MDNARSLRSRVAVCALLLTLAASGATARDRALGGPVLEPSTAYAAFVLAEVAGAVGMRAQPGIFRARVDAARAVYVEGREAIVYNPAFLSEVTSRAGTAWAAVSVIAHEIGHHYYGHSRDRIDTLPSDVLHQRELDADYFSGFALARMGATIEEAEAAQQTLFDDHGTPTHPGSLDRLHAIQAGWLDGRDFEAPAGEPAERIWRVAGAPAPHLAPAGGAAAAFPSGSW